MNKKVLSFVNKLEGYKTAIKELHWDADNMSQHQLCDDIADRIADFQDQVSEVEQSITGKLPLGNLKPTSYKVTNLKKFVEDVLDETNTFYKSLEDEGDTYTGMKSDCESFLSDMQRNLYLVNFTMKEDLKRRLRDKINESMPKSLDRHDEVDKFMGRKPKSIKARINQIYRIVKKYGIDSKLYSDENWQAINDYYRAISSLGCEVEMKPCGHLQNADSMESDGGYCDYGDDGMPRSKQYAIKIMFDDGMNIDGYIKCMAAGTVEDPFSRYDTCIVLWPKNNRILEGINEYGDKKETRVKMGMAAKRDVMKGKVDTYQNAINSLGKRGSSKADYNDMQKGFEMSENKQYKLSEAELKEVVKEAAMKLIKEYGDSLKGSYNVGKLAARQTFRDKDPHKGARTLQSSHSECNDDRKAEQLYKTQKQGYDDGKKEFDVQENVEEGDSGIHIKKNKEGTFTAAANKHSKSVQGFASQVLNNKDNYSPAMVKKANFARNAKKFKH